MKTDAVIFSRLSKLTGISEAKLADAVFGDAQLSTAERNAAVNAVDAVDVDQRIVGCSSALSTTLRAKLSAMGFDINDTLSRRPGSPEVRLRYDRGNGDLTAWLPSSRHMDYVAKGWIAVEVQDEAEAHRLSCAKAKPPAASQDEKARVS